MKNEKLFPSLADNEIVKSAEILATLSKVAYHYRRMLSMQSVNYDISPNEGGLMLLLHKHGDEISTASQVAKEMGVTKSLVSRSVDNLTKRGYITITTDELDRRVQHLVLSDEAKEICEKIYLDSTNMYVQAVAGIDSKDLDVAIKVMRAISQNFEDVQ